MPAPDTVAPLPAHFYAKCPHDVMRRFARCSACDAEDERIRVEDARRTGDPRQRIEDAIEARRRWFDRCAFCTPPVWSEARHAEGCPWETAQRMSADADARNKGGAT